MLRSAAFNRVQAELIFTELDLVKTFLKISRTSRETETQQRNRMHARKAYVMARRYASRLNAPTETNRAIEKRFTEVELALKAAGEALDREGAAKSWPGSQLAGETTYPSTKIRPDMQLGDTGVQPAKTFFRNR